MEAETIAARITHSWSCRSTLSRAAIFRVALASPESGTVPGTARPVTPVRAVPPAGTVKTGTSWDQSWAISSSSSPDRAGRPSVPSLSRARTASRAPASRISSGWVVSSRRVA